MATFWNSLDSFWNWSVLVVLVVLLDFNQKWFLWKISGQAPRAWRNTASIFCKFYTATKSLYVYGCVFVAQRAHKELILISSVLLLHLSLFKFQRPCAIGVERVKDLFDRDHLFHFHVHILCLAVNPEHTGEWYTNRSLNQYNQLNTQSIGPAQVDR